jgi:hypothetical protein
MGHVPMFYFRERKDEQNQNIHYFRQMKIDDKSKTDDEKNKCVKTLYDILADNNCIYLCADTHSFEIMNISDITNKALVQIICGTGGADPDFVDNDNTLFDNNIDTAIYASKIKNDNNFVNTYNIQGACANAYGYCKLDVVSKNKITVTYIKVVSATHATHATQQKIGNIEQFTYHLSQVNNRWKYSFNETTPIEAINLNKYKTSEICNQIQDPKKITGDPFVVLNQSKTTPCFEKKERPKSLKNSTPSTAVD